MLSCSDLLTLSASSGQTVNLALAITIGAFMAISWIYSIELVVKSLSVFKRKNGLYFWSLQVANIGVVLHSVAFILKFFTLEPSRGFLIFDLILITIGWWCMVTGQSVVLYSRLHLLRTDMKVVRRVLYMIVFDAIVFHLTTTTLTFGSNLTTIQNWKSAFNIVEKIQMTVFSVQECIISTIYAFQTRKTLNPRKTFQKALVDRVMNHLLWINILIIILDVVLVACEYANLYVVEATMKSAIYAFKLRVEFPILNQLTSLFAPQSELSFQGQQSNNLSQSARQPQPPRSQSGAELQSIDYQADCFPNRSESSVDSRERVVNFENDKIMATTEIQVSSSTKKWPEMPSRSNFKRI